MLLPHTEATVSQPLGSFAAWLACKGAGDMRCSRRLPSLLSSPYSSAMLAAAMDEPAGVEIFHAGLLEIDLRMEAPASSSHMNSRLVVEGWLGCKLMVSVPWTRGRGCSTPLAASASGVASKEIGLSLAL